MHKIFVFAHYEEAESWIKTFPVQHLLFSLKNIQYLQSKNQEYSFIITGQGFYAMSVALSVFFQKYPTLKDSAVCFNIGIAGSYTLPLYEVFCASKITNYHTQKSFYPDIFYDAPFTELISIEFPASQKIMKQFPSAAFDMEAYSFAHTLKYFVKNHQIHCIKFISDHDGYIHDIDELMNKYHQKTSYILQIIEKIENKLQKYFSSHINHSEWHEEIRRIAHYMRLTHSQTQMLFKLSQFYIQHHSIEELMQILNQTHHIQILSKHQRNQYFQHIINQLSHV